MSHVDIFAAAFTIMIIKKVVHDNRQYKLLIRWPLSTAVLAYASTLDILMWLNAYSLTQMSEFLLQF